MGLGTFVAKKVSKDLAKREVEKVPGLGIAAQFAGMKPSVSGRVERGAQNIKARKDIAMSQRRGENIQRGNKNFAKMSALEKVAYGGRDFAVDAAKGVAGAGAVMGLVAATRGAGKLYDKIKTERVWKRLQQERPELTRTKKDRRNFEVLQQFSPDIASNITTSTSYLERMKNAPMVPHEFVRDLRDVQSKGNNLQYQLADTASKAKFDFGATGDFNRQMKMRAQELGARAQQHDKTHKQKERHHRESLKQRRAESYLRGMKEPEAQNAYESQILGSML